MKAPTTGSKPVPQRRALQRRRGPGVGVFGGHAAAFRLSAGRLAGTSGALWFLLMAVHPRQALQTKHRQQPKAATHKPCPPARRSSLPKTRKSERRSCDGLLAGGAVLLRLKHLGAQKAQVHQARLRDSKASPFGYRWRLYIAHGGDGIGSAKVVNDEICVHARILGRPNSRVKPT